MALLDLVFPEICLVCGESRKPVIPGRGVCEDCTRRFTEKKTQRCAGCGAVIPDEDFSPGSRCRFCGDDSALTGLVSLSEYHEDDWLQQAILRMKHGGGTEYSRCLGYLLGRKIQDSLPREEWHGVTAVPLHFTRHWRRGYNQAELVAKFLARGLGVPLFGWLLTRQRRTAPQSGSPRRRKENVHGAFRAAGMCRGASLILVDDVFTTGATTTECADILHRAGAERILIATCAWVDKINHGR